MFLYALKWIAVTLLYQGFVHNIAYLFEFQENIALTYQNLSLGIETFIISSILREKIFYHSWWRVALQLICRNSENFLISQSKWL